jgi:hypothetical protein
MSRAAIPFVLLILSAAGQARASCDCTRHHGTCNGTARWNPAASEVVFTASARCAQVDYFLNDDHNIYTVTGGSGAQSVMTVNGKTLNGDPIRVSVPANNCVICADDETQGSQGQGGPYGGVKLDPRPAETQEKLKSTFGQSILQAVKP